MKDSTIKVGNRAEQAAAGYLTNLGYSVVQRNFRRPHCEIDIVACKENCIYFVEVKYRATNVNGSGFDYINTRKLMHMQRGAQTWTRENQWHGEYTLSAIEVGGPGYEVLNFVECL